MQRELKARNSNECIVGIDVSKAILDVCILPDNKQLQFSNDKPGHKKLIMELSGQEVSKIVLEATGIYHVRLHQALEGAGFCVAIVNPYRSRKFADVCGQLAKTDRIDARILAVFAQTINPPATPAPSELMLEIKMLSAARTSLIMDQTALKNRVEAAKSPYLKDLYKKRLEDLKNDIKALVKEILDLIRGDETYKRYFQILTSIPGIGNICAIVLVAGMPELGRAQTRKLLHLSGWPRLIGIVEPCAANEEFEAAGMSFEKPCTCLHCQWRPEGKVILMQSIKI
jgi:transposase